MLRLGGQEFGDHEALVTAIVERRAQGPDDRAATAADRAALAVVAQAVSQGAAAVDIDGPGDAGGREVLRTAAFVAAVRERHPGLVIGVRTGRHEVAEAVCAAGADLVDDAWGGADPDVARVAARHGAGLVCGFPGPAGPDAMDAILRVTGELAERAAALGVRRDAILVDPGHPLDGPATRRLGELTAAGWPVQLSLPEPDFTGGTPATSAVAAWLGVRVHRVRAVADARQVLDMVASIAGHRPPAVAVRGLG